MKMLVLLSLALVMLLPSLADADVFQAPGVRVERMRSPCVSKPVLDMLAAAGVDHRLFRAADVRWQGVAFGACWIEHEGRVLVATDDGMVLLPIPAELFKDNTI